MSLQNYIDATLDLVHDQSNMFVSKSQCIRWINEARRQAAQRTGCVRRLVTGQSAFGANAQPGAFIPGAAQPGALPNAYPGTLGYGAAQNSCVTIPGVERYPFVGFFNLFLQAQYAGVDCIIDVESCSVNWGGAVRPSLAWMPWSDLQAYARAYATLVTSYPYYWSVYNDGEMGEIWMFPAPSTQGEIELDAYCLPKPLYTNDDFDAIPEGFRNAIKYGAASLIYLTSQRFANATLMDNMFNGRLGVGVQSRDFGKIPNMYFSVP